MLEKLLILFLLGLANGENIVFTSGYSNKGQFYTFNEKNGMIFNSSQQEMEPNLTFLEILPDGNSTYFVHEVSGTEEFGKNSAVSFWKLDRESEYKPILKKLQTFSAKGVGSTHVKLHQEYGLVHLSNYGGSFTSIKINENGEFIGYALAEDFGNGSNVKPDRQDKSHPHGSWTFGPFVYVLDLGSDRIWHYKVRPFSTFSPDFYSFIQATLGGQLRKADPAFTTLPPGYGPRHMAIDSQRKLAYVVFELENFIGVYEIDESTGKLTEKYLIELVPKPKAENYPSEVEFSPSGKYLYVSNRGTEGAIIVFKIASNGYLNRIQVQKVGGTFPRHFKIHPNGEFIFVALQKSSLLEVYRIDPETGLLQNKPLHSVLSPNSPTIVGIF